MDEQDLQFASFRRRALAAFIDYTLLYGASGLAWYFGIGWLTYALRDLWVVLGWYGVAFLGSLIYHATLEGSRYQATIGKLAVGIHVSMATGEPVGAWDAWARNLARVLSTLLLFGGFAMALLSSHRLALHDRMARTVVLRGPATAASMGRLPASG